VQIRNQLPKPGLIGIAVTPCAQERDASPCRLFPVYKAFSLRGIHKGGPDCVAISLRATGEIAKNAIATFIPRDHIQMSIDEKCWVDAPSIENGLIGCGMLPDLIALLIWERKRTSRQKKQMAVLLLIQLQDICKAGKDLIGDINIPTLFEPCVPGNAHANQLSEFFSSESGLSTPGIGWEIKLLWTQTGTTGFQKIGKLCAVLSCFSHLFFLALLSSFGV
jgi:hypothetical protein